MPTDLNIPVAVHYMRNAAFPDNDVAATIPPHVLEKLFKPDGAFNAVWSRSNARIGFHLFGIQSCRYSLKDFGYLGEHEELPAPTSDRDLFPAIVTRYNASFQGPGTTLCTPIFADLPGPVLDLYLFWKINTWAGWAQPPRGPRPGAVWMDTDALARDDLERLFAHEVGHFLDLKHPCRGPGQEIDSVRGMALPRCSGGTELRLMAPIYAGTVLLDTEAEQARANADALFGG